MPANIILPQWGMGMNEGQVVRWLKSPGDAVAKGDPLVEIESTKVNAEVEATSDGTLGRADVAEGTTVPVGTVLGYLLLDGEAESDLPAPAAKAATSAAAPGGATPTRPSATASERATRAGGKVVATPRARRLAKQLGVDIATISSGTGPGGRITEDDVRASQMTVDFGAGAPADAIVAPIAERTPLTGMRGTIARRMTESAAAALVTLHAKPDITKSADVQRALVREWRRERVRPQFQDLVIAATVRALKANPIANSHLVADEVLTYGEINLGFALAVPDGLLVPVIRDAGAKSPLELARAVRDLARRAKSNELGVDDLSGSTFSITNLGSYGITHFTPLINPPEIGILGVGAVLDETRCTGEPAADSDGRCCTIQQMGHFSLTFDHRAWDGAPAAGFLQAVTDGLTEPGWMLDA